METSSESSPCAEEPDIYDPLPVDISSNYDFNISSIFHKTVIITIRLLYYKTWKMYLYIIPRFERCWPAMWKDNHGVVMVHNPDQPHHEKELERWSVGY